MLVVLDHPELRLRKIWSENVDFNDHIEVCQETGALMDEIVPSSILFFLFKYFSAGCV